MDKRGKPPEILQQRRVGTETIDLDGLFEKEVTESGSFNIGNEIWTSTFGKLIQALPIPVFLVDQPGNVIAANQACGKIGTGYETIVHQPFSRLFANPSDAQQSDSLVSTVFSTRKTTVWEALLRFGQSSMWGRLTFRAIRIKGQRLLLVLVEDLSLEKKQILLDRKHKEELEKRVKERTEELRRLNQDLLDKIADRKRSEDALRVSEDRYRRLFEDAPLMYVITRSEQGVPFISDCNGLFLRSVGYKRHEVLGKPLADFYSPGSRAELLEHGGYERALAGEFFIGERSLVTRDGRLVPTLLHTAVEIDSSGQVIGTRAMFVDITERKKAEEALRESEERFKAIFENHHAVLLIIDPETGRIMDGSPGACAFYGYGREELRTKKITDINTLSPDEIAERMQMAKSQQRRYFDFRHRLAGGEVRDVEVCSGPIVIGGRTLLFSVINDVTERKKNQTALRESEQRWRLIKDSSPVGIRIVQDEKHVFANPSFVRMFGYETSEQIVGLPVEALCAPDSSGRILRRQTHRPEDKAVPWRYEAVGITRNGGRFDLEASGAEIEYLGKRSSLEFVMDVSEAKGLRSQLLQAQKMEAIGTLAGGIAHDFNNLLTVILGYSDLIISEKTESDWDYEDLKKVIHAARTAGDMVQQILAFSRKTETKPRPINLNKQVEQVRKMLSRLIPKTIVVEMSLDPTLPTVNADPAQIDQVVINLAVNARDAMPKGGRLLIETKSMFLDEKDCRLHVEACEGPHALLIVRDTGIGMDRATTDRIFEPFYTTKKLGEGTGLGLAMVYGIVKSHRGHITCDSEPGKGSTFKICLPAHQLEGEADVSTSAEFSALGAGTILLVDDEVLVRQLGRRILEKAGYAVITAANGQEAVDIYKEKGDEIALVILDLIMPIMDGNQCLEEILKIDSMAKVLIASGHCPAGAARNVPGGGARRLIGKPYNLKDLLQTVREVLNEA
jgi:PAS domain S-box-containing protein